MSAEVLAYLLKRNPLPAPKKTPLLPQIVSEETSTYTQTQARRKRGRGSTILTGDLMVPAEQIGKKALLGS